MWETIVSGDDPKSRSFALSPGESPPIERRLLRIFFLWPRSNQLGFSGLQWTDVRKNRRILRVTRRILEVPLTPFSLRPVGSQLQDNRAVVSHRRDPDRIRR